MKKFTFQAILLISLITIGLFLYKTKARVPNLPFLPQAPVFKQLQINGNLLKVEIADTQAKRSKGLGGRQGLETDMGMLFIFDKTDRYPFWMKGLNFPLDFVWIRGDKVVDIFQNIQPPETNQTDESLQVYQSKEEVDKILEINSGVVQKLNIKVGDTIKVIEN